MKKICDATKMCLVVLTTIMLFGCNKDIVTYDKIKEESDVSTGPPVITNIMKVDRATQLSEADLSQLVLIEGANLSGLKSIKFNDVEADLSQAYVKAKEIIVPVPRILPGDVTNKVTVTTNLGETKADLKINIPALAVSGLFNEFALPGDTTTIVGNNFDIYKLTKEDAKVMFGSVEATILESDQTSLTVVVPPSIPAAESVVTVTTPELPDGLKMSYRHLGQIINIQNKLWAGESWQTDGNNLGDPKPINGRFSHIHDVSVGQWGWYDQIYGCNFPVTDPDILNHLDQYDLKFELNTDKDHPLAQMFIKFEMRFAITYEWNLYNSGESLNTYGKWQTITLDAKTVMGQLYPNNDNFFYFAINPGVPVNLDFSISSMRLVKKEPIVK
ncbi:glycan-binding surface protein [Mucilaginibacter segetis]|uniref:IPT/TIG domain-containing protein n=1 Tax=Mucilaginibacter segetis TaxID=2793071 RepID=A0A934UNA8_9SPHI|nr:glycan-binding surface protein [Mucilaginibacter segetis]MBK0379717.1 IPT/TIG domain-containing protein [Mucilaginibacter segetis]